MIVNLGAGRNPIDGALNIDRKAFAGVDLIHDLNVTPWPIPDGYADEVVAMDVLEHLIDLTAALSECHRILKPGGVLRIRGPRVGGAHQFADPTHYRAFTVHSLDYYCPDTERGKKWSYYTGSGWRRVKAHDAGNNVEIVLERLP